MKPTDSLEEYFDDTIPDEVLQDDSWEPALLPDLSDMIDTTHSFNDMIEDYEG